MMLPVLDDQLRVPLERGNIEKTFCRNGDAGNAQTPGLRRQPLSQPRYGAMAGGDDISDRSCAAAGRCVLCSSCRVLHQMRRRWYAGGDRDACPAAHSQHCRLALPDDEQNRHDRRDRQSLPDRNAWHRLGLIIKTSANDRVTVGLPSPISVPTMLPSTRWRRAIRPNDTEVLRNCRASVEHAVFPPPSDGIDPAYNRLRTPAMPLFAAKLSLNVSTGWKKRRMGLRLSPERSATWFAPWR